MNISPEIIVTPDYPTIRLREPREKVDLDNVLAKTLLVQGWGLGTEFRVQFISHDRTQLLASATFLVTGEIPEIHVSDTSAYQTMTKAVTNRKWERVGDWWEADKSQSDAPQIKWNPGKQAHEVISGDEVLASFTKDEGGKAAAEAFLGEKAA